MVTPASDEDLDFLRGQIGDKGETFVISQPELARMWTRADGDEDVAMVYGLRRMRAHYAKAVTAEGQDQRVYNNSLYQHYDGLVKEAERSAGMSGSLLSTTSLKLNLNLTSQDIEDREWDY